MDVDKPGPVCVIEALAFPILAFAGFTQSSATLKGFDVPEVDLEKRATTK
jgi:hypothetical protein